MGIFFSSFNGLEPKIRFREYLDKWISIPAEKIFRNITEKNHPEATVLTIQQGKGTMPRETSGRNIIYDSASTNNYKLVNFGDFIIHLRSFEGGLEMANESGIVSPAYTILRNVKPIAYGFYKAYFRTNEFINHVLSKSVEGIRDGKQISYEAFKWLPIPYCSLPEQEKIAAFLSLVDARIEKQRQLVEALKKYKRGLLSAIFDRKIRFKDNDGNNFPDWEFKTVADVFKITRGYVLPATDTLDAPTKDFCYPVYSSQTKNYGLLGYYNQYLYSDAITWTTDGANAGYVKFRKDKFYCTNVCGVLISDKGMANSYIAEKLNSITKRHVSYVGNPKLMNNVMAEITIEFPSIKEQQKLSGYIDNIEYLINMNNELLEKLNFYKRGLLQQMFI